MVRILGTFLNMFLVLVLDAQDLPVKKVNLPPDAIVNFKDGSMLRVSILESHLTVVTKYGQLIIPFEEIERIEFGLHYPENLKREIEEKIKQLDDNAHKTRSDATKYLVEYGQFSYLLLKEAAKDSQIERSQRAINIIRQIENIFPKELLCLKPYDLVYTKDFPIAGHIKHHGVKARSQYLGDVALKFSDISIFYGGGQEDRKVVIDAERYAGPNDQWFDTGITISSNHRLIISTEGQVDLWPTSPNQYLTGPKGHNSRGKDSNFPAGALVGKIGAEGKIFFIGDQYENTPSEQGKLLLQINSSPWNCVPSGTYKVRIIKTYKK